MSAARSKARRDVAHVLHASALRLLRRLRTVDDEMGLGAARASALSMLVFAGPKSPSELAALEQVARPTMTKLVQGLERDGLVRVRPDETDGRGVRVEATARGRTLLERGRERRVDALAELLAELDDSQVRSLGEAAELLARIAGAPERAQRAR